MRSNYFVYILPLVIGFSCSHSTQNTIALQKTTARGQASSVKPGSTFADTLKIDFAAAVFYSPDSLQFEKIKDVTKPGNFSSMVHENFYLMRNAHIVLNKYYPKVTIVDTRCARYLLFLKDDKSNDLIDLDEIKEPYGLFIFNREKSPEMVDMANVDTDLEFYFSH